MSASDLANQALCSRPVFYTSFSSACSRCFGRVPAQLLIRPRQIGVRAWDSASQLRALPDFFFFCRQFGLALHTEPAADFSRRVLRSQSASPGVITSLRVKATSSCYFLLRHLSFTDSFVPRQLISVFFFFTQAGSPVVLRCCTATLGLVPAFSSQSRMRCGFLSSRAGTVCRFQCFASVKSAPQQKWFFITYGLLQVFILLLLLFLSYRIKKLEFS
jgi:hypothetical protein